MKLVSPMRGSLLSGVMALFGVSWAGVGAANHSRPDQISGTGSQASRCLQCHHFEPGLTHPVDVAPASTAALNLPLENGLVTCFTCHDAPADHTDGRSAVGVRSTLSSAGLCVECHRGAPPLTKGIHALTTGKAHLTPGNSIQTSTGQGLDSESRNCMSCHDGAAASDAGSHAVRFADDRPAADHPVGIPMKNSLRSEPSDFKLANVNRLDKRLRLVNGSVGCGSCHSVYSAERAQLAIPNRGSKLCLSCHTQ